MSRCACVVVMVVVALVGRASWCASVVGGRSAAARCSSKGGCAGGARRRYYAVDPGCAEYKGKPQYKKVQADGSFCTPGRFAHGSQRLYWTGSWYFGGFGGPSGTDWPYSNRAGTPQPPHDGWEQ
jgi:hypothetical protein